MRGWRAAEVRPARRVIWLIKSLSLQASEAAQARMRPRPPRAAKSAPGKAVHARSPKAALDLHP